MVIVLGAIPRSSRSSRILSRNRCFAVIAVSFDSRSPTSGRRMPQDRKTHRDAITTWRTRLYLSIRDQTGVRLRLCEATLPRSGLVQGTL